MDEQQPGVLETARKRSARTATSTLSRRSRRRPSRASSRIASARCTSSSVTMSGRRHVDAVEVGEGPQAPALARVHDLDHRLGGVARRVERHQALARLGVAHQLDREEAAEAAHLADRRRGARRARADPGPSTSVPMWAACSMTPSSSMARMAPTAAAQAERMPGVGEPARVGALAEGLRDGLGHDHAAERHVAGVHALGEAAAGRGRRSSGRRRTTRRCARSPPSPRRGSAGSRARRRAPAPRAGSRRAGRARRSCPPPSRG